MRLHHIGIVVPDIVRYEADLKPFGLQPITPIIHDSVQQVKVQFWRAGADPQVELVEPVGPNSPARASLDKGAGLNHLCYEVNDLDQTFAHARDVGAIPICAPVPAEAFGGRRICFVFYPTLGLIEFVESP